MFTYRDSLNNVITLLKEEKINTWFDLGIYIDRFRETKPLPTVNFEGTYSEFKSSIGDNGIAFVTFLYSIDGVTIEVEKYAQIFRTNIPGISIHYIAGKLYAESEKVIHPDIKCFEIPEIAGFDDWPLYKDFFFTKLERGGEVYNELIHKFWQEVITIVEKLGNYIIQNNINLLYLINICSNPGNVSLALAIVLISEYLGIPVINNNHDFYWEGGSFQSLKKKNLKKKSGPRDFFFTNAHLGEFFSIIEVLYPWESRSWINVNINRSQSKHLVEINGHNPANETLIGTAVDTNIYHNISKRQQINAFYQFEKILSRYKEALNSYSVEDVYQNALVDKEDPKPILIGSKTRKIDRFLNENIIFLQPTRIIARKRIELGFKLIKKLFNNSEFSERVRHTPNLKITLIVTGPIALGHYDYYLKLIRRFSKLLSVFDAKIRDKIYLAFLFSELDKERYKNKFKEPVGIPELYNIASLVLLPSKTEGRGLPIIEATACGTPIFCNRYYPENVYSEVIGEHLPEKSRLKVIEFDGKKITSKHANSIIERVLFPHLFNDEIIHNKNAVKHRFSLESLTRNMEKICQMLYHQVKDNSDLIAKTETLLDWYRTMVNFTNEDLKAILNDKNRHYLPGYGRLMFMNNLKSLIDPSAFRTEEQQIRGFIHTFAQKLVNTYSRKKKVPLSDLLDFYTAVDNIFYIRTSDSEIRHDHSFSYRHRNRNVYPFQDFTIQELTGLVNILFIEFINPLIEVKVDEPSHFFTDLDLALAQLTASSFLAIDDRKRLIKKLQENIPFALFPGDHTRYELEFFILQAVRSRLRLRIEETLDEKTILKNKNKLEPVYIIANERSIAHWFSKSEIEDYILHGGEKELYLLYKHEILRIVNSRQVCLGLHFPQMGTKALKVLREIHDKNGFIIANRPYAAIMTDIVNLDRFHIGKVTNPISANMMGIPLNSGYIHYVPAGVRVTLAYPTPIQTAKDFYVTLNSPVFEDLKIKIGEKKLMEIIRKDAEEKGSPILHVLQNLQRDKEKDKAVEYEFVNGLYTDGMPWNGVLAKANTSSKKLKWQFRALTSEGKTKRVTDFVNNYFKKTGKKAQIAWNGGYILNPELVGKLGIPESYIGSPLGLLVINGKITCPPLFNKAALLINKDGAIEIKKINCKNGINISFRNASVFFTSENYNKTNPGKEMAYYDLMFSENKIPVEGRYIIRMAGNKVKEIIQPGVLNEVEILPVGLTLTFYDKLPFKELAVGDELNYNLPGFENVLHGIEAGPLLLENGEIAIDMENEGWKTSNSIRTQAARLDYTDMRGPKIAAGIDKENNFFVLVINGRIRESVGATHHNMAEILKAKGIVDAMGFDPGGSSTLVVEGKVLNISPYNHRYEENIYALSPEPRAVSNAIIGYVES